MLHPARRMWRVATRSSGTSKRTCPTVPVEHARAAVCAATCAKAMCPGSRFPARYFRYVHSRRPRPLDAVLEHNRLDLLSLALVTARAAQLLEEGPAAARTRARGARHGPSVRAWRMMAEARSCFARAYRDSTRPTTDLRGRSAAARMRSSRGGCGSTTMRRRRGGVCSASTRVRGRIEREASEALAVHLEHRARDPLVGACISRCGLLDVDER